MLSVPCRSPGCGSAPAVPPSPLTAPRPGDLLCLPVPTRGAGAGPPPSAAASAVRHYGSPVKPPPGSPLRPGLNRGREEGEPPHSSPTPTGAAAGRGWAWGCGLPHPASALALSNKAALNRPAAPRLPAPVPGGSTGGDRGRRGWGGCHHVRARGRRRRETRIQPRGGERGAERGQGREARGRPPLAGGAGRGGSPRQFPGLIGRGGKGRRDRPVLYLIGWGRPPRGRPALIGGERGGTAPDWPWGGLPAGLCQFRTVAAAAAGW